MLTNAQTLIPINAALNDGHRLQKPERLAAINALRKNSLEIPLRKGLDAGALRQLCDRLKSELLLLFSPCRLSTKMCKKWPHHQDRPLAGHLSDLL
jgi:hypothetical protein